MNTGAEMGDSTLKASREAESLFKWDTVHSTGE